jgi:hypothetical protein
MASSGMLRRVALSDIVFLRCVLRLLVSANAVTSSPILVTLMKEEMYSSETSVLARTTHRNIPEDGIFKTHLL